MPDERVRLLVVDDDPAMRSFLAHTLADEGRLVVTAAATGEEALAALAARPHDIVLTDLCLPGMDGLELLRRIRAQHPAPVVVAMTGYGTVRDAVSLVKHGAFDVLPKPFQLDDLKLALDKALVHHRLARRNRELEARLQAAERLAAIGKLAGGIAHEINNPLDGVRRFLGLVAEAPGLPPRAAGYLDAARAGLDRMAGIVRALLRFARAVGADAPPRPLGELVREALAVAGGDGAPPVAVRLADPAAVVPGGLVHVLANLLRNARQAAGPTGRVTLETHPETGGLAITVADSGPGVPPHLRGKIFEPFFTTKPMGAGTGLGLSLSREIVAREGGRLTLECPPEGGARFRVWLPRPARRPPTPPVPAGVQGHV